MRTLCEAVLCLISFALSAQPSLVLINGKIFDNPNAQAIAITGSTITAVGTNAEIQALVKPETRVVDVQQRLVIPGINDAHTHPGLSTPAFAATANIETTWPQVAAAISNAAEETPADVWITATVGPAVINDASITKQTLDSLAPNRKVFVNAFTGHGAVLSSAALEALGVAADEKNPRGGSFGRDARGNLDGRVSEYAHYMLDRRFADLATDDEILDGIRSFAGEAIRFGITSIQAMPFPSEQRFATLLRRAAVPLRVRQITFPTSADAKPELQSGRALKLILDGTPIERGAALRTAQYSDGMRGGENFQDLAPYVKLAVRKDQQLILHASGDRAVESALKAIAGTALKRPRIEHGDGLQSDLFALARKTGAVVVVNPTHFPFRGFYPAGEYMLAESIRKADIPLAIGSDGPINPYLNIMIASARPDQPGESLTRDNALRAYTSGSAYAENMEKKKGRIAPGMLADIAVLSQNILEVPLAALPDTRSVLTIIDGKVVHEE